MSTRFYCREMPHDGRFRLDADEARHLTRVCRFGVGDVVEVFDGRGSASHARVEAIGDRHAELLIVGAPIPERRAPVALTLASAVPKGERFDWLVEKATELGVERVVPIIAERSVVEPGGAKLERLRRLIVESSKQCRRTRLMVLEKPVAWRPFAESAGDALKLLADPEGALPLGWPTVATGRSVILAIGPEGGFTPAEIDVAGQFGWCPVSLGNTMLRIETAGLAGCALLFGKAREIQETPGAAEGSSGASGPQLVQRPPDLSS
jgi:16S rRNA (uracil1498-N3)-methyltransferase